MKTFEEMPMSNDLPSTQPAVTRRNRSFRWRLIPATFLFLMSFISLVAGVGGPLNALFVNLKYGWIVPDPEWPEFDNVALTLCNLTRWQLMFWSGVFAGFSAFAWMRGRWWIAGGTTASAWILSIFYQAFFPPH